METEPETSVPISLNIYGFEEEEEVHSSSASPQQLEASVTSIDDESQQFVDGSQREEEEETATTTAEMSPVKAVKKAVSAKPRKKQPSSAVIEDTEETAKRRRGRPRKSLQAKSETPPTKPKVNGHLPPAKAKVFQGKSKVDVLQAKARAEVTLAKTRADTPQSKAKSEAQTTKTLMSKAKADVLQTKSKAESKTPAVVQSPAQLSNSSSLLITSFQSVEIALSALPKEMPLAPVYDYLETNEILCDEASSRESKTIRCNCTPSKGELENGKGCGQNCINRLLFMECGSRCPSGKQCSNKQFQRRQYADVEIFPAGLKGWGLRARSNIAKGQFIIEYVGEVVDVFEMARRMKRYGKDPKHKHHYFMALRNGAVIDATARGNLSRFINHSCDPNAVTQKWTVNRQLRVGFFALRAINAGDEVVFNYQFERYGKKAQECYCLATNCTGFIGGANAEDVNEEAESSTSSSDSSDSEFDISSSMKAVKVSESSVKKSSKATAKLPTVDKSTPSPAATVVAKKKPHRHHSHRYRSKEESSTHKSKKKEKEKKKALELADVSAMALEVAEVSEMLSRGPLRDKEHVLEFNRLMVRVDQPESRQKMVEYLLHIEDREALSLFVTNQGLGLLNIWFMMPDVAESKTLKVRNNMVRLLMRLPIASQSQIDESAILPTLKEVRHRMLSNEAVVEDVLMDIVYKISAVDTPSSLNKRPDSLIVEHANLQMNLQRVMDKWSNGNYKIPKKDPVGDNWGAKLDSSVDMVIEGDDECQNNSPSAASKPPPCAGNNNNRFQNSGFARTDARYPQTNYKGFTHLDDCKNRSSSPITVKKCWKDVERCPNQKDDSKVCRYMEGRTRFEKCLHSEVSKDHIPSDSPSKCEKQSSSDVSKLAPSFDKRPTYENKSNSRLLQPLEKRSQSLSVTKIITNPPPHPNFYNHHAPPATAVPPPGPAVMYSLPPPGLVMPPMMAPFPPPPPIVMFPPPPHMIMGLQQHAAMATTSIANAPTMARPPPPPPPMCDRPMNNRPAMAAAPAVEPRVNASKSAESSKVEDKDDWCKSMVERLANAAAKANARLNIKSAEAKDVEPKNEQPKSEHQKHSSKSRARSKSSSVERRRTSRSKSKTPSTRKHHKHLHSRSRTRSRSRSTLRDYDHHFHRNGPRFHRSRNRFGNTTYSTAKNNAYCPGSKYIKNKYFKMASSSKRCEFSSSTHRKTSHERDNYNSSKKSYALAKKSEKDKTKDIYDDRSKKRRSGDKEKERSREREPTSSKNKSLSKEKEQYENGKHVEKVTTINANEKTEENSHQKQFMAQFNQSFLPLRESPEMGGNAERKVGRKKKQDMNDESSSTSTYSENDDDSGDESTASISSVEALKKSVRSTLKLNKALVMRVNTNRPMTISINGAKSSDSLAKSPPTTKSPSTTTTTTLNTSPPLTNNTTILPFTTAVLGLSDSSSSNKLTHTINPIFHKYSTISEPQNKEKLMTLPPPPLPPSDILFDEWREKGEHNLREPKEEILEYESDNNIQSPHSSAASTSASVNYADITNNGYLNDKDPRINRSSTLGDSCTLAALQRPHSASGGSLSTKHKSRTDESDERSSSKASSKKLRPSSENSDRRLSPENSNKHARSSHKSSSTKCPIPGPPKPPSLHASDVSSSDAIGRYLDSLNDYATILVNEYMKSLVEYCENKYGEEPKCYFTSKELSVPNEDSKQNPAVKEVSSEITSSSLKRKWQTMTNPNSESRATLEERLESHAQRTAGILAAKMSTIEEEENSRSSSVDVKKRRMGDTTTPPEDPINENDVSQQQQQPSMMSSSSASVIALPIANQNTSSCNIELPQSTSHNSDGDKIKQEIVDEVEDANGVDKSSEIVVGAAATESENGDSANAAKAGAESVVSKSGYWLAAKDSEGNTYYYHSLTRESAWELPPDEQIATTAEENEAETAQSAADNAATSSLDSTTASVSERNERRAEFKRQVSDFVNKHMHPYRKRFFSDQSDFVQFLRKITHKVLDNQDKCNNHELNFTDTVRANTKRLVEEYIRLFKSSRVSAGVAAAPPSSSSSSVAHTSSISHPRASFFSSGRTTPHSVGAVAEAESTSSRPSTTSATDSPCMTNTSMK